MTALLRTSFAVCDIAVLPCSTSGQAPSFPTAAGTFELATERLGPGTITLLRSAGGPGDSYPTIQSAVDAASEGDTVLLSDGLFYGEGNRDILVEGKDSGRLTPTSTMWATIAAGVEAMKIWLRLAGSCLMTCLASAPADAVGGDDLFRITDARLGPGTVTLVRSRGGDATLFPTIQAAVDAADPGDTVLLSDGLFYGPGNRDVVVADKHLTIRSEYGPERCVIDCRGRGRAFTFESAAVDSRALLQGVTIRNGDARETLSGEGGGVWVHLDAWPTIEACVLENCSASSGGAISYYALSAGPGSLSHCVFRNNLATNAGGAAIGGNLTVENCVFVNNVGSTAAGLYAGAFGGSIRNCLFARNSTSAIGATGGGAMIVQGFGWRIDGCTIVGNATAGQGGGIAFATSAPVTNSILWGNTAGIEGQQLYHFVFFGGSDLVVSHSVIEGGAAGGFDTTPPRAARTATFTNIIESDPQFAALDDYHLQPTSPCVDQGDPSFVVDVNEGDLDHEPRVNGDRVDIGADELWEWCTLGLVTPGRAGQANTVSVTDAKPGDLVHFFAGDSAGEQALPFGACRDLVIDIESPLLLGITLAGASGRASYSQYVPSLMSGETVLIQAVGFDPGDPLAGCRVSNRIDFAYP